MPGFCTHLTAACPVSRLCKSCHGIRWAGFCVPLSMFPVMALPLIIVWHTHFPIPLVFFSCLLSWKTAWHGAGKPEGLPCFCPCLKLLSNIKNNCVPACGPLAGLLAVYPVICFHSIVPPAFSALCCLIPWFCYGCLYCLLRWATRFAIGML